MTWLIVTEYMCHKWSRNVIVLSVFLRFTASDYHLDISKHFCLFVVGYNPSERLSPVHQSQLAAFRNELTFVIRGRCWHVAPHLMLNSNQSINQLIKLRIVIFYLTEITKNFTIRIFLLYLFVVQVFQPYLSLQF